MKTLPRLLLATVALGLYATPSHATLLYTLNFDAYENFSAATISYTTETFAVDYGHTLFYHSGDVNGCAPAEVWVEPFRGLRGFTQIPFIDTTQCGDGVGPEVDGLFFRIDDPVNPSTTGTFVSSSLAGRVFAGLTPSGDPGLVSWRYVAGTLVISELPAAVPAPATAGLIGIALAGLGFFRRSRSTRRAISS